MTVTVNGRHAPERDYFGADRQDAIDTREAMIQEAREAGESVTNTTTDRGFCVGSDNGAHERDGGDCLHCQA